MSGYEYEIEQAARDASKVVDEVRRDAFVRGALWAIERLHRMSQPEHMESMMDKGTIQMLNRLSLGEVRKFVRACLTYVKPESNRDSTPDGQGKAEITDERGKK